jgi:putative membrane protein
MLIGLTSGSVMRPGTDLLIYYSISGTGFSQSDEAVTGIRRTIQPRCYNRIFGLLFLHKEQGVWRSSALCLIGQILPWRPDSFGMAVISTLVFGLIGVFLALVGYKLFDWLTPRVHVEQELAEKHNIAVAIVIAAVVLGISHVVAAAITG